MTWLSQKVCSFPSLLAHLEQPSTLHLCQGFTSFVLKEGVVRNLEMDTVPGSYLNP